MDGWTDGRIVGWIWMDSELFLNININIYGYGTPDGRTVSLLYIWNLDMDGWMDGRTVGWLDGRTDGLFLYITLVLPCSPSLQTQQCDGTMTVDDTTSTPTLTMPLARPLSSAVYLIHNPSRHTNTTTQCVATHS